MSGGIKRSEAVPMAVACPFCGTEFEYETYVEITLPADRRLKKRLLNKDLFYPVCPSCGEQFKLKPNCVYRDDSRMVLVVVTDGKSTEIARMMKTGSAGLRNVRTEVDLENLVKGSYKRRLVYDIDAFREKILLFDGGYDDRIMELMKYSLSQLLEKEHRAPVYRIFLEDASGSRLTFTAFMGISVPFEPVTIETPGSVYFEYRKKYMGRLGKPEMDEYILTDLKWAKKSGLLEGEDPGFLLPS